MRYELSDADEPFELDEDKARDGLEALNQDLIDRMMGLYRGRFSVGRYR